MFVDCHQHIWTDSLVTALLERGSEPYVRRERGELMLYSTGELPWRIPVESEDPERRAALVGADGLDGAVIAISSPIGIEALPREQATALIAAHLDGVLALPSVFTAWGPVALEAPDAGDVDAVLDRGCVGVSIPAGALAGPAELTRVAPLLARVAEHGVPLLVHPGRAPGQSPTAPIAHEPLWWRPLTDYVAQMQAAWFTFAAGGREQFPDLKLVWTMLAGGAPLLHERFALRGGRPVDLLDPNAFYETSSYGPDAIDAMARLVGESQLVYGSDRPVVAAEPTGRDQLLARNTATLTQKVQI